MGVPPMSLTGILPVSCCGGMGETPMRLMAKMAMLRHQPLKSLIGRPEVYKL